MVLNTDLAPTLAELAGATPSHVVDGRSWVPLLEDPGSPWRRKRFLIEHYLSLWSDAPTSFNDIESFFGVRSGPESRYPNYKYAAYFPGLQIDEYYYHTQEQFEMGEPVGTHIWEQVPDFEELYDLSSRADPFELNNLLFKAYLRAEPLEILKARSQMKKWLDRLETCQGDSCRSAEDAIY